VILRVNALRPRRHSLPADHRQQSINKLLFGSDLTGEAWLDVRAAAGHNCLRALKGGAASATGLETSPALLRCARDAAGELEDRLQFIRADFEHWNAPTKSYDVVLCLRALQHWYDPISAIRKLMALARKRFYLEVPVTRWAERPTALLGVTNAPMILIGNPRKAIRAADAAFSFTRKSLELIINGHSKAYEPVRFHPAATPGGWIAEARRRQIDHLVVLGGVSGSGKSTLIKGLDQQTLRTRLGIEDDFRVVSAGEIDSLCEGPISTLVYHYDLMRPFNRSIESHDRDPAFHLLSCAKRITRITLAADHNVLRNRVLGRKGRRKPRDRKSLLVQQYENPTFLADWYEAWLEATDRHMVQIGDRSIFLLSDGGYAHLPDRASLLRLFAA
jgi:predicted kinase